MVVEQRCNPDGISKHSRRGVSFALLAAAIVAVGACASSDSEPAPAPSNKAQTAEITGALTTAGPTLTLQPGPDGKDARVMSLANAADTNYGAHSRIEAMAWTWSGVPGTMRSFIEFKLDSLPQSSVIRRATLVLSADTSSVPAGHSQLSGSNEWRLERIVTPWDESTVTWNAQPTTDPSDALSLPASIAANQTYEIDVTSFINKELQAPEQNHGFMLRLNNESHYRALQFASSDHANPALRPKLVIEHYNGTRLKNSDCSVDYTANHRGLEADFMAFPIKGVAPYSYSWDFGDGHSSTYEWDEHTYAQAGTYDVCLTMTDSAEDKDGNPDPCTTKICKQIPAMQVTGNCCDPNDKVVEKDVEYEPGHFAKFTFKVRNVNQLFIHSISAEVKTYDAAGKPEDVDHLYVDIMGQIRDIDTGKQCGTTPEPVDDYDNADNESKLEVDIPIGKAFGVGAGELSAFFKVRRGQKVHTQELLLAQCKADREPCSRDSACASGKCGGCLDQSLGWCYTPNSVATGGDCRADNECSSGRCSADCYLNSRGKCLCKVDSDCGSGEYCGWGLNSGKCMKKKTDGDACAANNECASAECGGCANAVGWCFTPNSKQYDQDCRSDKECATGRCSADCYLNSKGKCLCDSNDDCQAGQYCGWGLNSGKCIWKKSDHQTCASNSECQSNHCAGIGGVAGWCFTPHSKNIGQGCRADNECTTNRCVDTKLLCGCTEDYQCGGNEFCNKTLGECKGKKGKLSPCSRNAECSSGKCRDIRVCK